jgi:hypothetical protein
MVALASAGRLATAKELADTLAARNVVDGMEEEDSGVTIWALEQVAARFNQPEYDRKLWPHVRKKAEFLEGRLAAHRRPGVVVSAVDPLAPRQPPLRMYADSYRGLFSAAALAERVEQHAEADRWRRAALDSQRAWAEALRSSESAHDLSSAESLWLSDVARSPEEKRYADLIESWHRQRDARGAFRQWPPRPALSLMEARQWLWLGKSDYVWPTVRWLWDHQVAPGLYTWSEQHADERAGSRWKWVRAAPRARTATPHYGIAAQMAFLQLDMLAYADPAAQDPTVVIGPGIPAEWLRHPLWVRGLSLRDGPVEWRWDGSQVTVTLPKPGMKARLGSAFPSRTKLRLQ